jgi:hypothetical protein
MAHWRVRGGEQAAINHDETLTLDEKVRNAMKKLGLSTPPPQEDEDCEGGACPLPSDENVVTEQTKQENPFEMASRIASDMGVNKDLALAALGATGEVNPGRERKSDEHAARALIQHELDIIEGVPSDSNEVQQLVSEGHELFSGSKSSGICRREYG